MQEIGPAEAWAIAAAVLGGWQAWAAAVVAAALALWLLWSLLSGRRLRWRWVGRLAALLGAGWTLAGLAWATAVPLPALVAGGTDLLVVGALALGGAVVGRLLAQLLFARKRA